MTITIWSVKKGLAFINLSVAFQNSFKLERALKISKKSLVQTMKAVCTLYLWFYNITAKFVKKTFNACIYLIIRKYELYEQTIMKNRATVNLTSIIMLVGVRLFY